MADSSFDIVSKIDRQEADNALNQARKELEQRYDFKGTGVSIEWSGEAVLIKANSEEKLPPATTPRTPEQIEQFDLKRAATLAAYIKMSPEERAAKLPEMTPRQKAYALASMTTEERAATLEACSAT